MSELLNSIPVFRISMEKQPNEYKHPYVWFSGSWDNLLDILPLKQVARSMVNINKKLYLYGKPKEEEVISTESIQFK